MSNSNKKGKFIPCAEQKALWPDVSGNVINGVGETEVRRPSPVYWHSPDVSPYGPLQNWMAQESVKEPKILDARNIRQDVISHEPAPIAPKKTNRTSRENYNLATQIARDAGAKIVGVVRVDTNWVFEGYDFDFPWAIIVGAEMNYELLSTAPEPDAAIAVIDGYTDGWRFTQSVVDWIHGQGWRAQAHGGPLAGPVNLIPAAISAGFGELGKHGSIINRRLGSGFRLGAIFTDLPLLEDEPDDFGAEDFCTNCKICSDACPADAITHDKQMVRGVKKWYVDFDKCLPFFNEHYGCAVCVAACPWTRPGIATKLADKMMRRRIKKNQSQAK